MNRPAVAGVRADRLWWRQAVIDGKVRFDYLKPRTVVDLKRFSNQRERPVDDAGNW